MKTINAAPCKACPACHHIVYSGQRVCKHCQYEFFKPKLYVDREHMKVAAEKLQRLREVRLWHWRMVLNNRNEAEVLERLCKRETICSKAFHKKANFHLTFVQTLNEFFEIGDTAEKDAAK